MEWEIITSGDERIGKRAIVLRTGEMGTIDMIHRYADGSELFHLDLGHGLGHGGLDSTGIQILEGDD